MPLRCALRSTGLQILYVTIRVRVRVTGLQILYVTAPRDTAHCCVTSQTHTVKWAKNRLTKDFFENPAKLNKLLRGDDFESSVKASKSDDLHKLLSRLKKLLNSRPTTFEDCIQLARLKFEKNFTHCELHRGLSF